MTKGAVFLRFAEGVVYRTAADDADHFRGRVMADLADPSNAEGFIWSAAFSEVGEMEYEATFVDALSESGVVLAEGDLLLHVTATEVALELRETNPEGATLVASCQPIE